MSFKEFVARRWHSEYAILNCFIGEAIDAAKAGKMKVTEDEIHRGASNGGWVTLNGQGAGLLVSVRETKNGIRYPAVTFQRFDGGKCVIAWSAYEAMKAEYEKEKGSGVKYEPNAALLADYEKRAKERAAQAAIDAQRLERTLADAALAAEKAAVLMLEEAKDAWAGEPYLERKKVAVWLFDGIRVANKKLTARLYSKSDEKWHDKSVLCDVGDILVPMRDASGKIRNVQRIAPNGRKRPIMGAPVDGFFFDIPGKLPFVACEGLATGLSVAEATGRAVRVCFTASGIAKVIAATGSDIQLIAADNDVKYDDDGGISESRSHTGEKVARATGLPWAMPPLLDGKSTDWNDFLVEVGVEETKREFERRIRQSVVEKTLARREPFEPRPEFNPYKITPYELKGSNLGTWLNALNAEPCAEKAASMAWAICARRAKMVPVEHDVGQLVELVCRDAVAISDEMRAGIQTRLQLWVDKRKTRAMAAVSMPATALKAHRHEVVSELPTLTPDDYSGVIIVKAPMAAGKTQKIGAPFAAWAKQQAGRFVATCHRRSLVSEMAVRLGVTHYSDVTAENAFGCSALATCLPSITKATHASIYAECEWLFIDEVAQVLRFLEARDVCSTEDGTNADVYAQLKKIIKQARCVIVADAGCDARTLRFLEECRPKEAFRVIDMQAPAQGLSISAAVGAKAQASAFGEMLARCAEGERIWIGCESEKRVAVVARWLRNAGITTLALTGENKGDDEQKEFWDNPEAESLKYQAVVHSPVISSGLSIEHREHGAHFSHGFFIGGGLAVTPADAAQMMRRVRYLKTWTMVMLHNNAAGISDADSLLDGMEDAAVVEGHNPHATSFDELCAQIKADDAGSRADFCAGLWWILESAGFDMQRADVEEAKCTKELNDNRLEAITDRDLAILRATAIDDDTANRLRNLDGRTQEQSFELENWRIRHALGIDAITLKDYEAWDDGRIVSKLDRYSAAAWGLIDEHDATDEHLSRKRWWVARRSAYRYLFDGLIDVSGEFTLTRDDATELVRRVIERRFMLAFLGLVPAKYGEPARTTVDGDELAMPMPAYPMRDACAILARMGIDAKAVSKKDSTVKPQNLAAIQALAARRNAKRLAKAAPAPVVEVVAAAPAPRVRKSNKRDALKSRAFELAEQGLNLREIGAEIGVNFSTVGRWFKNHS